MRAFLPIKGYVRLQVVRDGRILARREGPNLVMQVGKDLIADILKSNSGAVPAATQFIEFFAIGSGTAIVDDSQDDLDTEITREAYTTVVVSDNDITYSHDFVNAGATWNVEELGLFTDAKPPGGIMVARWLSQSVQVPNGATLKVAWTLTLG